MGSIISAHSFYGVTSAKIIGECGICGDGLVSGRNQVYTMCEHLYCISCLLKWCKRCQDQGYGVPTCPLCRYPLYDEDEENGLVPQAIPFPSIETLHQYVPRIISHV